MSTTSVEAVQSVTRSVVSVTRDVTIGLRSASTRCTDVGVGRSGCDLAMVSSCSVRAAAWEAMPSIRMTSVRVSALSLVSSASAAAAWMAVIALLKS